MTASTVGTLARSQWAISPTFPSGSGSSVSTSMASTRDQGGTGRIRLRGGRPWTRRRRASSKRLVAVSASPSTLTQCEEGTPSVSSTMA